MAASGYVKIYGTILGSSVWSEAPTTRIVWITMLALADANGHVEASVPGLARFANVSVDETRSALQALSDPDPDSKSPEYEGRRIEKDEGGWTILNYQKYREMRSPKQVADAERQQAHRERLKAERDTSHLSQPVAATEEEAGSVAVNAVNSTTPSSARDRWKPIQEAEMADRLPTDAGRVALAGVLHVARIKSAVIAEFNACLSGERGPQHHCTLAQLDLALSDYFGNGMSNNGTWNANHFRACLRTAMRVPDPDIRPVKATSPQRRSNDDEAQAAVSAIRALIETEGRSRFIRRPGVEALGPRVLAAYDALGGPDRFLSTEADKLSFLVRDFAAQLRINHAA